MWKRSSTRRASFRDSCWTILTEFWMWRSLFVMIHPGRKSKYLIHRWLRGQNFYGIDGEPLWVRKEYFPKTYVIGITSNDFRNTEITETLILKNLAIELSSFPCSTTLIGTRRTMKRNVFLIPKSENYAKRSLRGHWTFFGPGSEETSFDSYLASLKGRGAPWQRYNDSWRQVIQFYRHQFSGSWSPEKK